MILRLPSVKLGIKNAKFENISVWQCTITIRLLHSDDNYATIMVIPSRLRVSLLYFGYQ